MFNRHRDAGTRVEPFGAIYFLNPSSKCANGKRIKIFPWPNALGICKASLFFATQPALRSCERTRIFMGLLRYFQRPRCYHTMQWRERSNIYDIVDQFGRSTEPQMLKLLREKHVPCPHWQSIHGHCDDLYPQSEIKTLDSRR